MDKPTANLIQIMRDRVKALREQGNLSEARHAANAAVLPDPSQSTVAFLAVVSIVGAIVSMMVNVALVDAVLPHESVAVNVTRALPVAPQPSLKPV